MVLGQVDPQPGLLEEAHVAELAHVGLLPGVRHLVQPPLVGVLELLVTVAALVGAHLHRLAVHLHHVHAQVALPDEVRAAVRAHEGPLVAGHEAVHAQPSLRHGLRPPEAEAGGERDGGEDLVLGGLAVLGLAGDGLLARVLVRLQRELGHDVGVLRDGLHRQPRHRARAVRRHHAARGVRGGGEAQLRGVARRGLDDGDRGDVLAGEDLGLGVGEGADHGRGGRGRDGGGLGRSGGRGVLLGLDALVCVVLGDVLHHVHLLAEAALTKLTHERLLARVGEDVTLDFAGSGEAFVTVAALEPGLLGALGVAGGRGHIVFTGLGTD